MTDKTRWVLMDGLCLMAGSVCLGVAVPLFTAPHHIAPGGITGLSTVLNYLWGIPIGTMAILLNLPLLLMAWIWLGRQAVTRSVWGILLSSAVTDLLSGVVPPFEGDTLLAALFGGVLMGAGLGLILMRGATTGGSEILARLLEKRLPHIPIGRLITLVDGCIILLATAVYRQIDSALYAVVTVYVTGLITDRLVYGGRRGKLVLIFSREHEEITGRLLHELGRGVTLLQGVGGYTGRQQPVLLCAVSRTQVHTLKGLVRQVDARAFFLLLSADEVLGEGFHEN